MNGQVDVDKDDKPVDTLYIGNEDIKVAVEKLKAELAQSRFDAKQTDRNIWLNEDEIIVLEHQEKERSMDC